MESAGDDNAMRAQLVSTFKVWNSSGSSLISRAEFEVALSQIAFSAASCAQMFTSADLNSDSYVDYQEFVFWICGPAPPSVRQCVFGDSFPCVAAGISFMQTWLASFHPPPPADLVIGAVGVLQRVNITGPEDLAKYDTNELRFECRDLQIATFLLHAQRFMRQMCKPCLEESDATNPTDGEATSESDDEVTWQPDEIPDEQQSTIETSAMRMDRLVEALLTGLLNDNVLIPDNIHRIAACPMGHQTCFIYKFGTKRIHVAEKSGEPVVRAGGGFMTFKDFAMRHGSAEYAKLLRSQRNGAGEAPRVVTSVMMRGKVGLR